MAIDHIERAPAGLACGKHGVAMTEQQYRRVRGSARYVVNLRPDGVAEAVVADDRRRDIVRRQKCAQLSPDCVDSGLVVAAAVDVDERAHEIEHGVPLGREPIQDQCFGCGRCIHRDLVLAPFRSNIESTSGGLDMTIRLKLASSLRCAVVFLSIIAVVPAVAQSSQRSGASSPAQPTVLGPAMLRPGDLSCGPGPAGLGSWSADGIDQTLSLNEQQRAKFNALKTASQRAIQYLNESCPKNDPATPTGRLETIERRLSAMLEAVRTVQPALDDFYAALTDEQKARLAAIEPSGDAASSSTDRDRRGAPHQRHARGRHFRFRLPL